MSENLSSDQIICDQMFDVIANENNAFFKSLQKHEQDLSVSEKRSIVEQLFNSNKSLFLQRYGKFLSDDHLNYFNKYCDNYEVSVLINNLRNMSNKKKNQIKIKNRRFIALQKLVNSGEYFSDYEMQSRNPLLFEQMIGQYMTEKEKSELSMKSFVSQYGKPCFSSFLLYHINCNNKEQQNEEEYDSDSDDSDDTSDDNVDDSDSEIDTVSPTKLKQLREEFNKIMYERFLSGKDSQHFDYTTVDFNDKYDSSSIEERDEEEKYFDTD